MKKFVSFLFVLSLFLGAKSYAQWEYKGAFPDTSLKGSTGSHGIAVDPDGKVWIQLYAASDSILTGDGTYKLCRELFVFNPDGTPSTLNKMKTITVGGVTDTLWSANAGLREDQNGNILAVNFKALYRVNYKTGEGMNKLVNPSGGNTLVAPGVDAAGDIFIRNVLPGNPVFMFNSDFTANGNAIDTANDYARTIEVSSDGNTVYHTAYTTNCIVRWNRPDALSLYTVQDTILKGFACESMGWNPKTHLLWASSGSGTNLPNSFADTTTYYSMNTWYAFDPATKTIKDSIKWNFTAQGEDARPRGIAFSPSGDTAYVVCFGAGTYPVCQWFVNKATAVKKIDNNVIKNYELSQNYPNPFNPATEISFSVAKAGMVTLKVYDILGKEVATLVNENMSNGKYSVSFDASKLASGTYIYQLNANGAQITKKMMLLK